MKTKNYSKPVSQNREPGNAKSTYRGADFNVAQNEKVARQHQAKPTMKK